MATYAWRELLDRWSDELLHDDEFLEYGAGTLSPEHIEATWVGYPGATEGQIAALEQRLGTSLPPSYREFLQLTNGWRQTSPFIYHLWPAEEVDWFAVRNQDWIDAYVEPYLKEGFPEVPDDEYLVYGDGQAGERLEHLQSALEVSDHGDSAIYLLNPRIVSPDGEWEAWFFANWIPGAIRYRSFWEMMVAEHESYLELRVSREDTH